MKEPLLGTLAGKAAAMPQAMLGPRTATITVLYSKPPFQMTRNVAPARTTLKAEGETTLMGTSVHASLLQVFVVAWVYHAKHCYPAVNVRFLGQV